MPKLITSRFLPESYDYDHIENDAFVAYIGEEYGEDFLTKYQRLRRMEYEIFKAPFYSTEDIEAAYHTFKQTPNIKDIIEGSVSTPLNSMLLVFFNVVKCGHHQVGLLKRYHLRKKAGEDIVRDVLLKIKETNMWTDTYTGIIRELILIGISKLRDRAKVFAK